MPQLAQVEGGGRCGACVKLLPAAGAIDREQQHQGRCDTWTRGQLSSPRVGGALVSLQPPVSVVGRCSGAVLPSFSTSVIHQMHDLATWLVSAIRLNSNRFPRPETPNIPSHTIITLPHAPASYTIACRQSSILLTTGLL